MDSGAQRPRNNRTARPASIFCELVWFDGSVSARSTQGHAGHGKPMPVGMADTLLAFELLSAAPSANGRPSWTNIRARSIGIWKSIGRNAG
jgi:hypothetical protein